MSVLRTASTNFTALSEFWRYMLLLAGGLLASILLGSLMVLWTGENPLHVYALLFQEAFLRPRGIMVAVQRATPLILTAAAATMAFKAGAINMALAGQFAVGAAIAGVSAYLLAPMPAILHIPLILLLSALGGAAAGFIPAFFTRMSGVHEIITGVISNYVLQYLIGLLIGSTGLLRMAQARGAATGFPESARLAQFTELTNGALGAGSKAHVGVFVGLALVLFLTVWMSRSKLGYEIRMTRLNRHFAQFAGIHAGRGFFIGMMLSGAIAGVAGAVEILGVWRAYRLGSLVVGEKDLIIALAGGQHFIGSTIAALVYGGLESGAMNLSWSTALPRPMIDMLVELIVIFAAVPSMRSFFAGNGADGEHLGGRYIARPE